MSWPNRALMTAVLLAGLAAGAGSARIHETLVRNVRIVDLEAERVSPPASVGIDNGKITKVSSRRLRGRHTIDGRGKFMLPGLWDMHVHALWTGGLWPLASRQLLASCVTGVRDMGGTLAELKKARVYRGPAPRLVAGGLILDGPQPVDPSVSIAVGTIAEARAAVSLIARNGDFVKIYTLLPAEVFAPLMTAANRAGLAVSGHVPNGVTAAEASRLGIRSIEHMQSETGLYCDPSNPATCRPLIQIFKRNSTWQTPTLIARAVRAHRAPHDSAATLASVGGFPAPFRDLWIGYHSTWLAEAADQLRRKRVDFDREQALARLLIATGVPILAGSDAGIPLVPYGESLHDELDLLVGAGASRAGALRAASLQPAKYFGRRRDGAIRAGARADFCLIDGNPLDNLEAARRPSLTVVAGRVAFDRWDNSGAGAKQ